MVNSMKLNDLYNSIRSGEPPSDSNIKINKFLYYAVVKKNYLLILRCLKGKTRSQIAKEVINIKYELSTCSTGMIAMMNEFSNRENDFVLDEDIFRALISDKKNSSFKIKMYTSFNFKWNNVPDKKDFTFNGKNIFTDVECKFIFSVICTKSNDHKVQEEFKELRDFQRTVRDFDNLYKKD